MAGSALAFVIMWCGSIPSLGRGRPYSETDRKYSGANGKHFDLAHLCSPHSALPRHAVSSVMNRMPDFSFERCDGHHETVDLKLRKKPRSGRALDLQRETIQRG